MNKSEPEKIAKFIGNKLKLPDCFLSTNDIKQGDYLEIDGTGNELLLRKIQSY